MRIILSMYLFVSILLASCAYAPVDDRDMFDPLTTHIISQLTTDRMPAEVIFTRDPNQRILLWHTKYSYLVLCLEWYGGQWAAVGAYEGQKPVDLKKEWLEFFRELGWVPDAAREEEVL